MQVRNPFLVLAVKPETQLWKIEITGATGYRGALFDPQQKIVTFQMLAQFAIETMQSFQRVLLLAQYDVELGMIDFLMPA
jgi:hypothetical protein